MTVAGVGYSSDGEDEENGTRCVYPKADISWKRAASSDLSRLQNCGRMGEWGTVHCSGALDRGDSATPDALFDTRIRK